MINLYRSAVQSAVRKKRSKAIGGDFTIMQKFVKDQRKKQKKMMRRKDK